MEIETGSLLVNKLRSLCDCVQKRLWIASPFIGNWTAVRKILGRRWVDDGNVVVRLITDISEISNFNYKTIKCFHERGEIKSIKGLHAKIYIIDDWALLTSANLTNTAFSKRYEIGVFLFGEEAKSLINIYNEWWENVVEDIPLDWVSKLSHQRKIINEKEEVSGKGLPVLWKLPPDPGDPYYKFAARFLDYDSFLSSYHKFAEIYVKNAQRIWPDAPLYFETDSFLNYLFHHAPGTPTRQYKKKEPRRLSEKERKREIIKYFRLFKKWVSEGSEGIEKTRWREESSKEIRKLLSKENILKINRDDIKKVVDQLNCMNSVPLAKSMFLNPKNNKVEKIRDAWTSLLHGDKPRPARMNYCKNTLKYFGRSSIHEILGYFEPDKYPLRNTNSNAGLRFFGYDVSAY
jgi:hypothetical protein